MPFPAGFAAASCRSSPVPQTKSQAPANSFRAAASVSVLVCSAAHSPPGFGAADQPAARRPAGADSRTGELERPARRHDVPLLSDGEQVVPGVVDHQTGRECREHEGDMISGISPNIFACIGSAGAGFILVCTHCVMPIRIGQMPTWSRNATGTRSRQAWAR